jgi:hypothetical protein
MSWIILFKKQLFDLSGTTKKLCPRQENTIQNTAKLVRTITFLSFQMGQLYLVGWCMTIMTFVWPWPLTSRSNNCFLNSMFLSGVWTSFAEKKRKKLELWVTSLSDTSHLQYYDVQTLEYRYISKLPMKN